MATATDYGPNGYSRSPSLPTARSPDTASSIYPDRAIRPLPRNRLKSKLSPEQASTIKFPPEPPPISPSLSFTPTEPRHHSQPRSMHTDAGHYQHHHDQYDPQERCMCETHGYERRGDSGDEDGEYDSNGDSSYRSRAVPVVNGEKVPRDGADRGATDPTRGMLKEQDFATSSGDGYDSFENASNKKKRKIPLSGAPSTHQSQLSVDMANMGISNGIADGGADDIHGNGMSQMRHAGYASQQNGSSVASGQGTGISGAGRGRYGRQESKYRRPLGISTMNTINGYGSRGTARNVDARHQSDSGIENSGGIISQAIKTAAEQGPLTPAGKGRENASLLQSATSPSSTGTTKTQFTFFRESESANKMVDQHVAQTPTPTRHGPPMPRGSNAQNMQAPPTPRSYAAGPATQQRPPPPPVANGNPPQHAQQQNAPPQRKPRPRRNPTREYALQAETRKKQQQVQNMHHRLKPDNLWICEFCEYEDIYGVPPMAMIRAYEIKDRQERKKAAEKRRLLEKARMKGRKNKKGSGKGGKNNHSANDGTQSGHQANSQNYDPNLPPPDADEYYDDEDEYGDEYSPMGHHGYDYPQDHYPPPAPLGTPAIPVVPDGSGGGRDHLDNE